MGALIVLAITFVLLWVFFIRPQQQRVRGHQQLVASLEVGDEVVLSAGIYGRIVDLGPEDMWVRVAEGVVLRVARQAVLRRVEIDIPPADPTDTRPTDPPALAEPADTNETTDRPADDTFGPDDPGDAPRSSE
jgi:preprotein translocase subunit YajC